MDVGWLEVIGGGMCGGRKINYMLSNVPTVNGTCALTGKIHNILVASNLLLDLKL